MKIQKSVLVLLILVGLVLPLAVPSAALAQTGEEPTGFQNVWLKIYPEYDDPRLLVMMQGKIEGVTAPAKVRFLVPAAAEMYSAGSMDAQGVYSGGPPDRKASDIPGWDEISYTVKTDTFRVEYYDPIILGNPEKSISYEFRWLYPISGLDVYFQEPRRAADFTVSPPGRAISFEGFNAIHYSYGGLDDEPPLRFDITYTRSDRRPSLEITDGGGTMSSTAAIVAGVILVIVVVGFFWFRRKPAPRARADRRRATRSTAAPRPASRPAPGPGQVKARFCTGCGQPVESNARFCAHCGAKLT
ncbi:MAG TPA: zinc ribbon domain-containing protein [Dehalococcoidales bacterium]|nr:zinc ribbon domain-containing protein [Dehalococcoidales bacterium]